MELRALGFEGWSPEARGSERERGVGGTQGIGREHHACAAEGAPGYAMGYPN